MTPAPNPTDTADQADHHRGMVGTDLLRVLNELRFGQHSRLPAALRDDLDYHAGLLRLRIHRAVDRAARPHTTNHITEHHQ